MLCLSFINSVIRKLRQIKTQPSYRRDNKLHRNCNLTLPCQSHIYQQSVTAASYSFFYDPAGFFRNILHSSLGGQNFPRIRASEPSPRLPPHWQYGETKHLKFINVFEKKIEIYALNILKNNKKKPFTALNPHLEQSGHYSLSFLLGSSSSCPICAA